MRLACVMVGLPARGKTYIARKLSRYLSWLGMRTQVFNVGNYRRKQFGASQPHNFFDSSNSEARLQRTAAAMDALEDMKKWFNECDSANENQVAIYDATNTTRDRRLMIKLFCDQSDIEVLFIESICDDEELILENIREVKLSSPDYRDTPDEQKAVQDFRKRIQHYADIYEPLDSAGEGPESEYHFVKLVNVRAKIVINRVSNYLESRIVFFLVNLHISPRSIYITRHGESQHNVEGKIGGDALLSEAGEKFASSLPHLLQDHLKPEINLTVWTSTLRRTIQTASKLSFPRRALKALDELDAGVCDGLTYQQISEDYPEDYAARDADKYNYRYRGGESYADIVHRIEPIIMELERAQNVLIISHQAVIRAILAYFLDKKADELPYIQVPLHTLIKLTPKAYGCNCEMIPLPIPAVNTFRPKPN